MTRLDMEHLWQKSLNLLATRLDEKRISKRFNPQTGPAACSY